MAWTSGEIIFDLVDDLTSDPVVTIVVGTPVGTIRFMAEPEFEDAVLVLRRTHVQGLWANPVGGSNLRVLARVVMERMVLDGLIVEGAVRTTGANPGRGAVRLRFARNVRASPEAGSG